MRLDTDEARRRFAGARVARLATVGGGGKPHLVPVTFAVWDDIVVTAVDAKPKSTTDLRRLRNIAAHPEVCLLADAYDEDWSRLWWVRADGRARVLTAEADRVKPLSWLSSKYDQYVRTLPAGPVIRVEVSRWTGWSSAEPGPTAPPPGE